MAHPAGTSGSGAVMTRRSKETRVVLGPVTMTDAPVLFRWINDRELVLHSAAYRPVHEGSHREWVKGLSQRRDLVAFGIRMRRSQRLIGVCQLTAINAVSRSADLQIRIGDAAARGKGLGLEAVRLLVAFGFRDLNLHRVSLQVLATNRRAVRTYERAGFQLEGTLRDAAFVDGRFVDVLVMSLLEGEPGD